MSLRDIMWLLLLYITPVESLDTLLPERLKPGETGKYIYTEDGVTFKHCLYCDVTKAFQNDESNKRHQEYRCGDKYSNITAEITPYERDNKLYPVCKIGTTPGCGPPPDDHKTADDKWVCDLGYSNVNYSVYFSCSLVNKHTQAVTWSYYCNESLQWDVTIRQSIEVTTRTHTTDGGVFKDVLIAVGALLVLLVIILSITIVYILCYKGRHRDEDSSHDPESKSALMNVQIPSLTSDKGLEASTPLNTSRSFTGSDITESTNADDKPESSDMSSIERLPPYGQEETKNTGCQTDLRSRLPNNSLESQVQHHDETETLPRVRAEIQRSLTSDNWDYQCPASHFPDKCPLKNADNNQGRPRCVNDLNKADDNSYRKEIVRSERPNPLGNISNNVCSDFGCFDDEDDNRHNTELKQIVNERVTECKKSNNCKSPHSYLSRRSNRDTSLLPSLQGGSSQQCESQRPSQRASQRAEQTFEVTNEIQGDEDSFEIKSYDLKS
ncbi:uncharacterized protein LOC132754150 [Ruditapes philippinarum]|uniref:uncharacterized protein LOC132754150 n=1 Tax=Ruditapes philippinarum TaxID=129788 RepID=UPI00295B645F|nr:uncharacterized protein LOC132754150 [Ruditapes philippinarum]